MEEFLYNPNADFFGTDEFQYSVTAVEKSVTKTATVNITVNSVNDKPEISFTTLSGLKILLSTKHLRLLK